MPSETALKFDLLFEGRRDVRGVLRSDGSIECVREVRRITHTSAHLDGRESLAVYPLMDDGTCRWACVDFDCTGNPEDAVEAACELQKTLGTVNITSWLELSKGKGAHLWVFFSEKVRGALAKGLLSAALGLAGVPAGVGKGVIPEIFPKQESLSPGQVGNCLNLPYYGPDAAAGKRVVLSAEGALLSAEEFAEGAINSRVTEKAVRTAFSVLLENAENMRKMKDVESGRLSGDTLKKISKIMTGYWMPSNRHYLALGLAGLLAKRGFTQQATENLIKRIVQDTGDEQLEDRINAVASTFKKLEENKEVTGISLLAARLEPEALRAVLNIIRDERRRQGFDDEEDIKVIDDDGAPAFLAKPPVEGLLKEICDYFALSTDANLEIRAAAALSLLSLLLGRRVWLQEGRRRTYPNLWMFVVGPSSDTRKSTLQFLSKDLWESVVQDEIVSANMFPERTEYEQFDTGIKDDEKQSGRLTMRDPIWDDDFSPEALSHKLALISAVCRYTVGMVFTDEAALHLEALQKKDYLSGTLGQMLKLYDCPRKTGFERRQGGKRTPYRIENVFINWFLVTTPQTLTAAATDQIKYSGFFQRCCMIPAGPREKDPDDFQPPVPDEITEALVHKLKMLALVSPTEAQFSEEAKEAYLKFAKELRTFRKENSNLLEADLLARLDTITKKLSIIMEMTKRVEEDAVGSGIDFFLEEENQEPSYISKEAVEQAVGLARYLWKAMAFIAENWLSVSTFKADRRIVMDVLQREKGVCSKSVLLKKTDLPVKKLDEILETLAARKEIVITKEKPKGKGRKPVSLIKTP